MKKLGNLSFDPPRNKEIMISYLKNKFRNGIEMMELINCYIETYYPFRVFLKEHVSKKEWQQMRTVVIKEINEYFEILEKPLISL
jgi:hypothetical protein